MGPAALRQRPWDRPRVGCLLVFARYRREEVATWCSCLSSFAGVAIGSRRDRCNPAPLFDPSRPCDSPRDGPSARHRRATRRATPPRGPEISEPAPASRQNARKGRLSGNCAARTPKNSGGGGIRTLGGPCGPQRFSSPFRSARRASRRAKPGPRGNVRGNENGSLPLQAPV
jgi:hypothetical protein